MIETGASKEPKIVVFLVNTILLMLLENFFKTQQQSKEKYFVCFVLPTTCSKKKKKKNFPLQNHPPLLSIHILSVKLTPPPTQRMFIWLRSALSVHSTPDHNILFN